MVLGLRGRGANILLTGGLLVGGIIVAQRLQLGERLGEGAFGLGRAGGNIVSQPIAGIVSGLTDGLNAIKDSIPNFLDIGGTLGADFQEFVTGNRDAIGDFFSGESANTTEKPTIESTFKIQPQSGFSLESLGAGLFQSIGQSSQGTAKSIADTSTGFNDFIESISKAVNPPNSPTQGLYVIEFSPNNKSGVLPLSQAAIDFHRKAGNKVTRVG